MWLKACRYFIIIIAILSHGIVGTLSGGNIIFSGLIGYDLTVNVFACLLGLPISIFLMIIAVAEHSQGEDTTTTLLFETVWVTILWAVDTSAAALISRGVPAKCLVPHPINWKWDVCVTYTLLTPASWISVIAITAHVLGLVILVQWHRARVPRKDVTDDLNSSNKLWAWFKDLMQDEAFVMGPLLGKSVYSLLQARSTTRAAEQSKRKRRHTVSLSKGLEVDIEKTRAEEEHKGFSAAKPNSNSEFMLSPFSEAPPAYLSPPPSFGRHARFDSIPDSLLSPIIAMYDQDARPVKVQLRDEPKFDMVTAPQVVLSPGSSSANRSYPSSSRAAQLSPYPSSKPALSPQLVPYSPLPPTPSPTSPRPPARSNTLPTRLKLAAPAPVHRPDETPSVDYRPALSRSRTIASTRRFIPSRYANIDLVAEGYLNRFSARFSDISQRRSSALFP